MFFKTIAYISIFNLSFFSIFLLIKKSPVLQRNIIFAVLLAIVAYTQWIVTLFLDGFISKFIFLTYSELMVFFMFMPLWYIYLMNMLENRSILAIQNAKHLIGLFPGFLYWVYFNTMSSEEQLTYLNTGNCGILSDLWLYIVGITIQVFYCVLCIFVLKHFIEKNKSNISETDINELHWHYWVIVVFVLMAFSYIILYTLSSNEQNVEFLSVLFIDIIFLLMFIRLIKRPSDYYFIFKTAIVENTPFTNVNLLSREAQLLNEAMDNEVYLDKDLSIIKLSERLNLPVYKVSQIIKVSFHSNFFDYINTYRVHKAIEWFNDPKKDTVKIDFISQECGFKNRSSFFNAFKKITGTSPANYRNNMKTKHIINESGQMNT